MATLNTLADAQGAEDALVILTVNAREHARAAVHHANHHLAQTVRAQAKLDSQPISEGRFRGMGVVLVDRFSEGRWLPRKQGVGLARKITGDLALAWMADGFIEGRWMRCTDADALLPTNYWSQPGAVGRDCAAAIFPFVHLPEGDRHQRRAMVLYDAYLRYYAHGLAQAGSPYAFPTIGSLLCIDGTAYAKVRGFPKRMAGEDFYILNKLAKVGNVATLAGPPVRLEGRTSDRVPFGTGVAVTQIRAQLMQGQSYQVYNPVIFVALGHWLRALDAAVERECVDGFQQALDAIPHPLGPVVRTAAERSGSIAPIEESIRKTKGKVLRKRIDDWSDAFRTLKMVHALRDSGLGTVSAETVLGPFMEPHHG